MVAFGTVLLTLLRLSLVAAALVAASSGYRAAAVLTVLLFVPLAPVRSRRGRACGRVRRVIDSVGVVVGLAVVPALLTSSPWSTWSVNAAAGVFVLAAAAHAAGVRFGAPPEANGGLGLPPAACAGLVLLPLLCGHWFTEPEWIGPTSRTVLLIVASIAAVWPSPVPRPSWKRITGRPSAWLMLLIGLIAAMLSGRPWTGVAMLTPVYLVLAQVCIWRAGGEPIWRRARVSLPVTLPMSLCVVLGGFSLLATLRSALPARAEYSEHGVAQDANGLLLGFQGPLGNEGLPTAWRLFRNPMVLGGLARATAEPLGDQWQIRLTTERSSFAIDRILDANAVGAAELSWQWCAEELPRGGDVRIPSQDDQALQVIAYFDHRPATHDARVTLSRGKVIAWIWDSTAPVGTVATCGINLGVVKYEYKAIVVRSGPSSDGWVEERRDLAADYAMCYPGDRPPLRALRVQANSQHTGGRSAGAVRSIRLLESP